MAIARAISRTSGNRSSFDIGSPVHVLAQHWM
jgi:hypothetical protein